MDALASISGLATGIDFRSVVDQIIEVESSRFGYLRVGITRATATRDAWDQARTLLETLRTATDALRTGSGLNRFATAIQGGNPGMLEVTAGEDAVPGTHRVRILERAQRASLGSSLQASRTTALGLSGSFVVGGVAVEVGTEDSLGDIAAAINASNTGANPSGVTASIVGIGGSYRMVLSAAESGADGVDLRDVGGVLGALGFLDGSAVLKHRTSGGFTGDLMADGTTAVGTLLGFGSGVPSGTVTLGAGAGAFTVSLDLASLSLEGVRDQINTAAATAGSAMRASVEAVEEGGVTRYRLAVEGTASAVDDAGVLQALGVLEGGRAAVQHRIQGGVLASDGAGTPATGATLLTDLFDGASNAGVVAGDSILFQGTTHQGTAFSFTHVVQAGDTLATLAARLEGAEGFNGGATVAVSAEGRLEVTATSGGASRLSLSAFAGNEGGGLLDLGGFEVVDEGRQRELSAGRDAQVEIDGFLVTSASNEITDVLPGVTLNLRGADPGDELEVTISRDVTAGVEAVKLFVEAYNALTTFVDQGVGLIGDARPALAGDSVLRGIRFQIKRALETVLPSGASGSPRRLADIGIEVTRDGTYSFDAEAVAEALRTDASAVLRLLGSGSTASSSALGFVSAGQSTPPGTYEVAVTQAPARATVVSSGFGGTYLDDGVADVLRVADTVTGGTYEVALQDGMTLSEIVDALGDELGRATRRELTSDRTLYADAGASAVATESTALADLHHAAGSPSGFVSGTTLTFSGTRRDGTALLGTFEVTDPATQTVGDLLQSVRAAVGSGVRVSMDGGRLVVEDRSTGASQLALNVGSDVAGNEAPLGAISVTEEGRAASGVRAEEVDGELRLSRSAYGSGLGFTVSFAPGDGDGTGSLGLASGTFDGTDVVGTIGGEAATGVGDRLTADEGTTAAGLVVRVGPGNTGALGTVTFDPGVGEGVSSILDELLAIGSGSIDQLVGRISEGRVRLEDRLARAEERLEDRRSRLLAQFAALETAMARAQAQLERLGAQLASLPGARDR